MMDELLAILGAEAALLVFIAAVTLRRRRMDVLSGRYFERPPRPHRSVAVTAIRWSEAADRLGLPRLVRAILRRIAVRPSAPGRQIQKPQARRHAKIVATSR